MRKTCQKFFHLLYFVIALFFSAIFVSFPFLNIYINHLIAQILWYISLVCFIIRGLIVLKRTKKPIFVTLQVTGLLSFLIIFISAFVINYYQTSYSWYWAVFVLLAVEFPVMLLFIKKHYCRNINLAIYIPFYLLLDLFYLSIFNKYLIMQFIFGGLVLIFVFYNLAITFLKKKDKDKWASIGILQDFVVGIGLTIYLIYRIPASFGNLQSVVVTLVSAIYGGLLTLTGVAWTIRRQDDIRMQDDINKIKPILLIHHGEAKKPIIVDLSQFMFNDSICTSKNDSLKFSYLIQNFKIRNTDYAAFFFVGIIFNNVALLRNRNLYVEKNQYVSLEWDNNPIYINQKVNRLFLIVEDVRHNYYYLELGYEKSELTENSFTLKVTGSKEMFSDNHQLF